MSLDPLAQPHRRYDPLSDTWVLVSAERTKRPWQGQVTGGAAEARPAYDPDCYLCPGNERAGGARNPPYTGTLAFTNDFPALRPDTRPTLFEQGLLRAEGEPGTCRVLCFSHRHDLSLGAMPQRDVRGVVDLWADQTSELGAQYRWVQVFENRGAAMGASNPHPHGQVWAGAALPVVAAREDVAQERHWLAHGQRLLLDYATQEHGGPRVVHEDAEWLVVVPFWAVWPFETLVIARRPVGRLPDLDGPARDALAGSLVDLIGRYDRLFDTPLPYSMGWHQAPFDGGPAPHWQLHAHFYPPLLSAAVRKFMVGYELLAEPQRDLTAEEAAERLRSLSTRSDAAGGRGSTPRSGSPPRR